MNPSQGALRYIAGRVTETLGVEQKIVDSFLDSPAVLEVITGFLDAEIPSLTVCYQPPIGSSE